MLHHDLHSILRQELYQGQGSAYDSNGKLEEARE